MRDKGKKIIIVLIWVALWQGAAMAVSNSLILPDPADTAKGLLGLLTDSHFYMDACATIYRCMAAILLSLVFGFLLALCAYRWSLVKEVLALPVSFFKSVPIMAVAIYLLLLLSSGNVPIFVCFVMCFPIVYTNLLTGLVSMDGKILEMAKVYDISGMRKVRYILLPQLHAHFQSAMLLITGVSWKAVVTAEVLSIPRFSLGYELMNAKYYLETATLFAYVALIVAISMGFEKLVRMILERFENGEYARSRVRPLKSCTCEEVPQNTIKVSGVSKRFEDMVVLDSFSFILEGGKKTALMGSSGAGKTTLGRILCSLENADCGEVPKLKCAVLFQEDRLVPWMNVYDNLALVTGDTDGIHMILNLLGLGECEKLMPGALSGGMAHRVSMARMLLYAQRGVQLILADEPFRGLDSNTKNMVIEKIWKPYTEGKTVLLITHSEEDARSLSDVTILMK